MTYAVKEVFYTLQGEGSFAGRPAVFVRFIGCNLWTGREEDRARDAQRHGAACPRWCDTDFRPIAPMVGLRVARGDLALMIANAHVGEVQQAAESRMLVVFTGGEPLIQLDVELLDAIRELRPQWDFAIETNGSIAIDTELAAMCHVCVSPKLPPDQIRLRAGQDLKLVHPDYPVSAYRVLEDGFVHLFIQPNASPENVGGLQYAALNVMAEPRYRLSIQTHKVSGIR